jgi:hypothetical protein
MSSAYRPLLQQIKPETPLLIENGWGIVGIYGGAGWNPISPAIVRIWQANELLAPFERGYVLSERGEQVVAGKVSEGSLRLPEPFDPGSRIIEPSNVMEGMLFTRDGICQLCGKKMEVFGQISHAKSHKEKGDPVMIEEKSGKKFAVLTGEAPAQPLPVPTSRPKAQPKSAVKAEEGDLFDDEGICRLCADGRKLSVFGWISHAKSAHISKGDKVAIIDRKGKKIAIVEGK